MPIKAPHLTVVQVQQVIIVVPISIQAYKISMSDRVDILILFKDLMKGINLALYLTQMRIKSKHIFLLMIKTLVNQSQVILNTLLWLGELRLCLLERLHSIQQVLSQLKMTILQFTVLMVSLVLKGI